MGQKAADIWREVFSGDLRRGEREEAREHGPRLARKVSLDHLRLDPGYYRPEKKACCDACARQTRRRRRRRRRSR